MLIKALCDYADAAGDNNSDFFTNQPVHYEILLTPDGKISDITDIRETETYIVKGNEKTKLVPTVIQLPKRTQKPGIDKNTIEHRPLYIFGLNYDKGEFSPNDKTDKAKKSHKCFADWNREFFSDINSEIAKAFCNFIDSWDPEKETENEILKSIGKDYSNSYFRFALSIRVDIKLDTDPDFLKKYNEYCEGISSNEAENSSEETAMCSILGKELEIARIHDKIKGISGGNPTGCVLVGMKEPAFTSYGKTQSFNSNVSKQAMIKYTITLNALLSDKKHYNIFDGMTIIYFAIKNNDDTECDLFARLLQGSSDNNKDLTGLFAMAKSGIVGNLSALGADENADFYVAGLVPNSSRISQKFILHKKFSYIIENLVQHQRDLSIGENQKQVYFNWLLKELVSPKSSNDIVPPPLVSTIFESMISGINYPNALLETVVRRVKTDNISDIGLARNETRIKIIKACLNRKARHKEKGEVITMALNKENNSEAYLCGRLFAVLEKIQRDSAEGSLNRTIKDSFFSSACSKPATVFPRLIQLSQHHLKKIEKHLFYDKLIGEIMDKLESKFPQTLSLDKQGEFIIGYFQETQDLYKSKENTVVKADL